MTTREPETEAGRALVRSGNAGALGARPDLLTTVLAIEAELRASLAEKVRALEPDEHTNRYGLSASGFEEGLKAAARLIEGSEQSDLRSDSDPASPEPREEADAEPYQKRHPLDDGGHICSNSEYARRVGLDRRRR